MIGLVILVGATVAACIVFSRHLSRLFYAQTGSPQDNCRHARMEVLDGEIDICWSCGIPMPREEAK
jgi:hypothetical protein